MGLMFLLTRILSMEISAPPDQISMGREYMNWLYSRVIQNYCYANPLVFEEMVYLLKLIIRSIKKDAPTDISQNRVDVFFQELCLTFPAAILEEFKKDRSFMDALKFNSSVT